jgi:hypothetical protein
MVSNRQIRRILFATDFLASSNVAPDHAITFAWHFKATIVMFHAVELPYPVLPRLQLTRLPFQVNLK